MIISLETLGLNKKKIPRVFEVSKYELCMLLDFQTKRQNGRIQYGGRFQKIVGSN